MQELGSAERTFKGGLHMQSNTAIFGYFWLTNVSKPAPAASPVSTENEASVVVDIVEDD